MDFAFSEEQEMLRASAREFLGARYPVERVAELADGEPGWDPASWRQLADLGWIGLSVPAERGGAGGSLVDEAVLFEEAGRALYPGPWFATVGLALPALEAADPESGSGSGVLAVVLDGERSATLAFAEEGGPLRLADAGMAACKAREESDGWRLDGAKFLVPDLTLVDDALVVARAGFGVGIWQVDLRADRSPVRARSTMDSTRRLGDLVLDATPATLLAGPDQAEPLLASTHLRALAALACEAVGVASRALAFATEQARSRHQFGRPIGSFQAISHRIADAYMATELARSLAYWAAWTTAESDPQAPSACAAAKAAAGEAATLAAETAIQCLGGLGFTWDHPLHRFYKRAQWIATFDGTARTHRADLATTLLDP
jgi:alkylation response protein AidB-like acyl-CoA dehydrogenase